jgi:hypothetical protein
MNMRLSAAHVVLASVVATGALASTGCTVQTTTAPPASGQVTFDWMIDERSDPNLCAQSAASTFHVEIIDPSNNAVTDYSAPCDAGATTITLTQGAYSAQAWLEDSSNTNRTTMVSIPTFTINSIPLDLSVDFPASSFE